MTRQEPSLPALAADRALLRRRLAALVARPEVREAIFVASPSLDEALEHWVRDPDSEKGRRVEWGLVRYLCRMASRPTPFGLFAGISLGRVAKQTCLRIGGREANERHTRLDNDYLFALVQALAERFNAPRRPSIPSQRQSLRAQGASATSRPGSMAPCGPITSSAQTTLQSFARPSPERRPVQPARSCSEALGLSRCRSGRSRELRSIELISAQVLVPDLELPVTGTEPLPTLIRELEAHPSCGRPLFRPSGPVETTLAEFDRSGGTAPARYRELARSLEPLPAKAELATLFQVDLVKRAPEVTIGDSVLREIDRAIEILHRLGGLRGTDTSGPFPGGFPRDGMKTARSRYSKPWTTRSVWGGIIATGGDPSPLLRGIGFPESPDTDHTWEAANTIN